METIDLEFEDDKWETWGIAARWDTERGWHSPTDEW
jgi:hypothetical protein